MLTRWAGRMGEQATAESPMRVTANCMMKPWFHSRSQSMSIPASFAMSSFAEHTSSQKHKSRLVITWLVVAYASLYDNLREGVAGVLFAAVISVACGMVTRGDSGTARSCPTNCADPAS